MTEEPCGESDEDEALSGDDNLVWVWVHTRDPAHPRFHDTFNKVTLLCHVVHVRVFRGVSGDANADALTEMYVLNQTGWGCESR